MSVALLDLCGKWLLLETPHGAEKAPRLAQPDIDLSEWLPISVPGDIHAALQAAGRIPDPYFGLNLRECRWTVERDWWYRRDVVVPKSFKGRRIELVFDGIDTFSTVYVNGQEVGCTSNMFRGYRFDVTKHIQLGTVNTIAVCIGATLPIIEARDTSKYFACFYTPRIFARKAQCHFSWDWAPNLPALGIWEGVRLEGISLGVIENVFVRTRVSGDVMFHVTLDSSARKQDQYSLIVKILDHGKPVIKQQAVSGQKNFIDVRIPRPELWWPNGYGKPHLYTYTVSLFQGEKEVDRYSGRFGIREVKLIQEPMDENRRSFQFQINGVDVFCLGANWVPADCFPGTVTEDRYRHLLRLAQDAHFNMLRLWGGGIYEKDIFYDLCDEHGIMVWQDFMFACADIPDDDAKWTMSLVPEFEYQVQRLRNHPCVVLWCGGNEKTGWCGEQKHYGKTVTQFLARGVANDLSPDLPYIPCSPFSLTDAGNDLTSGDSHKNVWEDAVKGGITNFREHIDKINPVFASEFGLFSPPQLRSLKKFIPQDKLWPLNGIWGEHVQENPYSLVSQPYLEVQETCSAELFHEPASAAEFVKVAGTFHAEVLQAEFEHHRRRQPGNAGALVWMFNDTWPCGSWALVDYYGLPKQAYYAVKRASAPVIASFRAVPGGFDLYITTNIQKPLHGTVRVEQHWVETGTHKPLARRTTTVPAHGSVVVMHLLQNQVSRKRDSCLHAAFEYQSGEVAITFFPHLWKGIAWPNPEISMKVSRVTQHNGEYRAYATLTTKQYARCVNLSTKEDIAAYFSDNYFDMVPGQTKRIVIQSAQPFNAKELHLNHWLTCQE